MNFKSLNTMAGSKTEMYRGRKVGLGSLVCIIWKSLDQKLSTEIEAAS